MSKTTKKNITCFIDKELNEKLNKHIEKNALNKSRLVEKLIKEYLEKEGKSNDR
jgi:metal-responsive CopG/Arc/MetJ family transcriptional regulator